MESTTRPKPRYKQEERGSHIRHFSKHVRSEYDYEIMNGFLVIFDTGEGMVSLTRFMSEALYELYYHRSVEVDKLKIIAMDEHGYFDAVFVEPIDKTNLTNVYYFNYKFKPLREKYVTNAMKKYNEKYAQNG